MTDPKVEAAEKRAVLVSPRLVLWIALGLAAIVVLAALYARDRGLEITDEAYYLLSASQPENIKAYISPQHWILSPLWAISGDLASFRLIGLGALLGGCALLSSGVAVAITGGDRRPAVQDFGLIFALSLPGALLYLTTINLSPSYNLMASAASYAAIGLSLLAATRQDKASAIGFALMAGLMVTIEFASKPSSGASTFLLLGLFYVAKSKSLQRTFALWIVTGFGLAASLGGLAIMQGPLAQTAHAMAAGFALFRVVQSEPILLRLLRYGQEYLRYLFGALVFFLPAIAVLCFAVYRQSRRGLGFWFLVMLASIWLGRHYLGGSNYGATEDFVRQINALLVMLLVAIGVSAGSATPETRRWLLIAGLFLAPYSVAVGTGNAIYTQVIDTAAPWGALMAALAILRRNSLAGAVTGLLALMFAATLSSQIVSSLFRPSYHLSSALVAQTVQTDAGIFGRVWVDDATATFVTDVKQAAETCGIAPGATYLGLYNNPGLALILRARTVTSPWITNAAQAELLLPAEVVTGLHNVVVARSRDVSGSWPVLPASLARLETEFRFCGGATYPYGDQEMQIWFRPG